jgi:hypothetical protein
MMGINTQVMRDPKYLRSLEYKPDVGVGERLDVMTGNRIDRPERRSVVVEMEIDLDDPNPEWAVMELASLFHLTIHVD